MNRSLWEATAAGVRSYPALAGDLACDVLVVGGGIAGLTSALLLQRAGVRVTLIEARRIGAGETGRTTAHLTEVLDARYHVLASKFGEDGAREAAEASRAAIGCIETLAHDLGIECGFRRTPGYLYAENEEQLEELGREADALVRVGAETARSMDMPLPFPVAGIVRVENQARFHPLRYLVGLAEQLTAAGGQIFEQTRLCDVHDGTPCTVGTDRGAITAGAVLVMTNVPVSNRFAIHTKIAPYRSYAVSARLPGDAVPEGLFWDLADPYHYIRGQETLGGRRLIVGGEDHKTGQEGRTEDRYAALESYVLERFPGASIERRWSGQIIEPADGLPFIGRNSGSKQVFVATGFSGTGMTFGTLAGMILSDAILDHQNPWADLFEATRIKPVAQARRYVAENADFPAHLASDRFDRGEVGSVAEVPAGEGRLVRCGGKMLAVYRSDDGALQARSAVCTHLGCHVHWNDGEKSWDCPCHGSRFDTSGQVINGPAVNALPEAEAPSPVDAPGPETV